MSRRIPIAILLAGALSLAGCQPPVNGLARGEAVPAFRLPTLAGDSLALPGSQRGRWLLIHFWADWCSPCLQELQASESVYRRYYDQGLMIVAVNIQQPREQVARVAGKLGISYPVLLDISGEVARRYGVNGLPASYLVDRSGLLHARLLGGVSGERLEQILVGLL